MVQRRRLMRLGGLTVAATIAAGGLSGPLVEAVRAAEDEAGSGQLAGQVLGSDGAPLAGAIVTVTSPELDTGDSSLTTDDAGRFSLGELRPGFYDVAVELSGFRRGMLSTLKVESGLTTNADLVLERRTGGEDGY